MSDPIQFPGEETSNSVRQTIFDSEPHALRTFTPSQAVFSRSAGTFHWTPEGRRLYDYSSGVLVANLGHNPRRWMQSFCRYMGWDADALAGGGTGDYFEAVTMTAYNALTEVESQAVGRLLANIRRSELGQALDSVMWAASGSEAVQKALWACLHHDEDRDIIIATRYGFHGKKGLAGAVTGSEDDSDRDHRVRFISFPREECDDASKYGDEIDLAPYRAELDLLFSEHGTRISCLITEPYLGGGGSYHPPEAYMQMLGEFCRDHNVLFILDEIQSNFGRTGEMYAFEKYGVAPDFVLLGKGLGNGVPVAAAVGRSDVIASLAYGEASDTWSANPLSCAAVLATLDEFEQHDVLEHARELTPLFFAGLERLKETGVVAKVRGEGMVFGIECNPIGETAAEDVANVVVEAAYLGREGGDGIHLLGPLAGKVIRVSPPLTMTVEEAQESLQLLVEICADVAAKLG